MVIEVVPSINNAVTINSTRDYTAYFTMHYMVMQLLECQLWC